MTEWQTSPPLEIKQSPQGFLQEGTHLAYCLHHRHPKCLGPLVCYLSERLDSLLSVRPCTNHWISPGLHFLICEMGIIWAPPHLWLWGFNEKVLWIQQLAYSPTHQIKFIFKRLVFTTLPDVEKTLSVFRLGLSSSSNKVFTVILFGFCFCSSYSFLLDISFTCKLSLQSIYFLYLLFSFLRSILLWDQDAISKFVFHLTHVVFFFGMHPTVHSSEISYFSVIPLWLSSLILQIQCYIKYFWNHHSKFF